MNETNTTKKPRNAQKFVIGVWTPEGHFVPSETQPENPITEFAAMLAWARDTFRTNPGHYSFIRLIQGNMLIERQTTFLSKFGMEEYDDTIPMV